MIQRCIGQMDNQRALSLVETLQCDSGLEGVVVLGRDRRKSEWWWVYKWKPAECWILCEAQSWDHAIFTLMLSMYQSLIVITQNWFNARFAPSPIVPMWTSSMHMRLPHTHTHTHTHTHIYTRRSYMDAQYWSSGI